MSFLPAERVAALGQSVFSEMTRLALEHGAINLAQGFPDFDGPEAAKAEAARAIAAGLNQYSMDRGLPALRQAIAAHSRRFYDVAVNPDTEVTVTAGATEAVMAVALGLLNPGDEVVMFEPYFDCYRPDVVMAGGVPRMVALRPTPQASGDYTWEYDPAELAAAFNARTRMMLLNSPHNPTGKVFREAELRAIAELCARWDVIVVSDEVYEHLTFDGERHGRFATLPGMAARTITLSSSGKIFNFTGWRVGWAIAPPPLTDAIRRARQYLSFCAPTPLQVAVTTALAANAAYFEGLRAEYQARRDFILPALRAAGLRVSVPRGAYFIMAEFSGAAPLRAPAEAAGDDVAFCRWLTTAVGVAAIPASAMFSPASKPLASRWARFAFCKQMTTLEQAAARLRAASAPG